MDGEVVKVTTKKTTKKVTKSANNGVESIANTVLVQKQRKITSMISSRNTKSDENISPLTKELLEVCFKEMIELRNDVNLM